MNFLLRKILMVWNAILENYELKSWIVISMIKL